jgi:hypothetical protein
MSILDSVQKKLAQEKEQARKLGLSSEREMAYYRSLSVDGCDQAQDEAVFETAIRDLNLSDADRAFIKRFLEQGDPR